MISEDWSATWSLLAGILIVPMFAGTPLGNFRDPNKKRSSGRREIGKITIMDTSSAVSGCDIRPRVVYYQGGDILLNEAEHISMTVEEFPYLADCVRKHLVVTDGTTLLGADDKAGIAEIVTLAQRLMAPDARLSLAGLPCPNLSTGGYNFHGRYEFIPVESMEQMVEVLLTLTTSFAEDK